MIENITSRQFEIIESAGKILTNSGVGGLTIKNLAHEMQFSESAIYRHFTSKEKIIVAMLEYLAESMDERFTEVLSQNISSEEKFTALFKNQFLFFKKNPHFVAAVFSDGLMEGSDTINDTIQKIMKVKMKHLKPIIIECQQKKIFTTEISSDDLIHIIMGTIRLQMYKWSVSNFKFDIVKSGEAMIQSLLKLIKI